MTPDQIRWLTWGAIQHRPKGAPKWDEPGTAKAIADHCGTWGLEIATEHVLAHARDPKARTPFAIKGNAPHTEPGKGVRFPAKPGDDCPTHPGEWSTSCRACAADALAGDEPTPRAQAAERPADHLARLRVIHDETAAELCSHHVPRANCLEHSRPSDPTPEESA